MYEQVYKVVNIVTEVVYFETIGSETVSEKVC